MRLLDPETFIDRPYVAGLNQGGHTLAGAALVTAVSLVMHARDALALALLLSLAFEVWQLRKKQAAGWDAALDLFFWWLGALVWSWAVISGFVTGPALLFPVWLILLMGAVMLAFTHIFKPASKED